MIGETLFFSFLVSLFTQGLGAAATDGGLLYPLRLLFEKWSKTKALRKKRMTILMYKEHRQRSKYQRSEWVDDAIVKLDLLIFYRDAWHKPILSCIKCMPSFWGTVLFLSMYNVEDYLIGLCAIPIASAITILTHKLRI